LEPLGIEAPAGAERTAAIVVRAESREHRSASATPEWRASGARTTPPGTLSMFPPVSAAPVPDEPPVVQVTIGRVDVRAVQAATPAPPAPSRDREPEAAPRQTLGEYLKEGALP
jgi:hypothetical protein